MTQTELREYVRQIHAEIIARGYPMLVYRSTKGVLCTPASGTRAERVLLDSYDLVIGVYDRHVRLFDLFHDIKHSLEKAK